MIKMRSFSVIARLRFALDWCCTGPESGRAHGHGRVQRFAAGADLVPLVPVHRSRSVRPVHRMDQAAVRSVTDFSTSR